MNNLRNICSNLNLDYQVVKHIFEKLLTSKYDNLVVDLTRPDARLRKNFTEIINI